MTRISFIMPTYNRADYIAESIEIILAQMDEDDELIVVDDGSTDATPEVVRAYAGRLRYLRQENAGKSAALNRAMSCTDGEFVWICDDDDLLRPGSVDLLFSQIDGTSDDMVFGRYTRFRMDNGVRVEMGTGYWPDLSRGSIARHILEDSFVMHNASLVRRSAYDRLGPFDIRMLRSQDYEMFVRLALNASIRFVDSIIFDQRKHEGYRGPATMQHASSKSDNVWQKFDAIIFEKLPKTVPLAFFEGMFESESEQLIRRAALLQRAAIMGRHGLWREAINDWQQAANSSPTSSRLHGIEKDIVWRAVAGKHGFSGLLESGCLDQVKQFSCASALGQDLGEELANGMIWRLKGDDLSARNDAKQFIKWAGSTRVLFRWLTQRLGLAPKRPDLILERADINSAQGSVLR